MFDGNKTAVERMCRTFGHKEKTFWEGRRKQTKEGWKRKAKKNKVYFFING